MLRYTIIRRVESGPIIGLHWMPGWALGCRSNTTAPAPLRPGVRQQHVKGSNQHIIHSASTRPKNTIQNARQLRRSALFIEPCGRRDPSSVGAAWWPGCWATTAGRWRERLARGDMPLRWSRMGLGRAQGYKQAAPLGLSSHQRVKPNHCSFQHHPKRAPAPEERPVYRTVLPA